MTEKTLEKANMPIEEIIQIICAKLPTVQAIYLFGSVNTAFANAVSDVDLAVLAEKKIDNGITWQLAQEIAKLLKKDVDLIDLWQASTVMRREIINTGSRLFCKNAVWCDEFENTALSTYLRFNEERREILEDIQKRGSIF